MNRCPITYSPCRGRYAEEGLKRISSRLTTLNAFPYTAEEQVRESAIRAAKMSIQGVQPKLSAVLNLKSSVFEVVTLGGRFILKPQNPFYPELPENEDVTMRMAAAVDIQTPLHGLIYSKDGSLTYFIKRFDRIGRNKKLAMEDLSLLMALTREAKYQGSMEKVAGVIDRHCTFPAVENVKLFRLTVFCFLTGNEDMHLKNFSLLSRDGKVELSPAYDLLSTSIAIGQPSEELALPLKGRKRKIDRAMLVIYYGKERLKLSDKILSRTMDRFMAALPEWERLIDAGFLSDSMKERYLALLLKRKAILFG